MDKTHVVLCIVVVGMLMSISGCGKRSQASADIAQTGFPGQVTAGGGTGGKVLGHAGPLQGVAPGKQPPPTAAQAEAAAAKKAQAAAQAEKDKQALAASIDVTVSRWRTMAAASGLPLNPSTPVAPAAPAATVATVATPATSVPVTPPPATPAPLGR